MVLLLLIVNFFILIEIPPRHPVPEDEVAGEAGHGAAEAGGHGLRVDVQCEDEEAADGGFMGTEHGGDTDIIALIHKISLYYKKN